MNLVSEHEGRGRFVAAAAIAFACFALIALSGRAQAAENIYWDNYKAEPNTIGFAGIDGGGGGLLNLTGVNLEDPEGMAYDTVTNRLFVGSSFPEGSDAGQIVAINLDGSGASAFTAPGAVIEEPEGIAVDPIGRMIYWVNTASADSIGWAKLDGSAGGVLNTTGTTVDTPYKIAFDPASGKVYWANNKKPASIAFANGNNSGGGGTLNITGAPSPENITGLSVDPAGGRIYWLDNDGEKLGFASLAGGGGGEVKYTGAAFDDPYGLAFDPSLGRLYWANYGQDELRTNALGFANVAGGVGGITLASAPLNGAQDPVVLKSPSGAGIPAATRSKSSRSSLSCSQGTWAADYAGSFVYQAPRTFAYQWTLNGKPVAGATGATLVAKKAGSYACTVTAGNQIGSASQTSAAVKVAAAKLKLTVKTKKVTVKAGKLAKIGVQGLNQGDLKSKNVKVCVKLPKSAKGDLKPKCASLGKLAAKKKKSVKLKVKALPSASGLYKLKIVVKGASGKAATAKVQVLAGK